MNELINFEVSRFNANFIDRFKRINIVFVRVFLGFFVFRAHKGMLVFYYITQRYYPREADKLGHPCIKFG